MSRKKSFVISLILLLVVGLAASAGARMTADQVARLGNDLTPLGGEKAGNADGTIPAWSGGQKTPPAGYEEGGYLVDPFAADKVLFTITAANMDKYADKLTEGHKALLKAYDTYKLNIYPTRRSAASPQYIYEATRRDAGNAELAPGGAGYINTCQGIPFPQPKEALEVIQNHLARFRGEAFDKLYHDAIVNRDGSYTLIQRRELMNNRYHQQQMTLDQVNNCVLEYIEEKLAPPRFAGQLILLYEPLDYVAKNRQAWTYNPGQRRVRRAPNFEYDNPLTASDGTLTVDQRRMWSGKTDRYDWKLIGKKEMYVPYNAYKANRPEVKIADLIRPLHLNQDLLRYELHRVWVVEADLAEGKRHVYKKRIFYVDEDSWNVLVEDCYDNEDQLWRVSESQNLTYYQVPVFMWSFEEHYDLLSGRYFVGPMMNETRPVIFTGPMDSNEFTPAALRQRGKR